MFRIKFFSGILLAILLTSNLFAQRAGLRWADELNLTESQINSIIDLRAAHQKKMIDLRADMDKLVSQKRDLMKSSNLTKDKALDMESKILDQQKKIRLSAESHRMDIYNLLDASQKEEFQKMGIYLDRPQRFDRMKFKNDRRGLRMDRRMNRPYYNCPWM